MKVLKNESVLIQLISEGDEKAFREVFDHFNKKLYNYTFKITDDDDLAEEIVMDAFIKVWCNREKLGNIISLDAYLFTIVKNKAFTELKRRAHEAFIIKNLSKSRTEFHESTEETIITNEYQHILSKAINQLPPQQKIVYGMSRDEGLKYEEIAEQLKLSKNTVKSHLKKALYTIRLVMSNYLVLISIYYFLFK
jgi:RNA polymerase sigma-70 factor (family 1)